MVELTPLQQDVSNQKERVMVLELEHRDAGTKLQEAQKALWELECAADKEKADA